MTIRVAFATVLLALFSLPALAAPPHPRVIKEIREGKRPEHGYLRQLREKGPPTLRGDREVRKVLQELKKRKKLGEEYGSLPAPGSEPFDGVTVSAFPAPPSTGSLNVLTLLVSFSDVAPVEAPAYFDDLVYGGAGPSVAHYYGEVSAGTFSVVTENPPSTIQCEPLVGNCTGATPPGWLPLSGTKNDYRLDLRSMLVDAVAASDGSVDFSRYDSDGDGFVDYVILVHVGSGGEWTGENSDIWSQTVNVAPVDTAEEGVQINTFMTVPEYWFLPIYSGFMTTGIYVHEFGHLLGLPDLYDTTLLGPPLDPPGDLPSRGIGDWGLMGLGSWNGPFNRAESPAWPSAWSRIALGWVVPEMPTVDMAGVQLTPVEQAGPGSGGPVYYLWDHGADNSEFFLIENRQKLPGTYDEYLPGHGLLVWHVDETMPSNDVPIDASSPLKHEDCEWPAHYRVALQQADGLMNLEGNLNDGDIADPYPGNFSITAFSPTSTGDFPPRTPPNSGSYADCGSLVAARNIAEIGSDIWLDLEVSGPPELVVNSYEPLAPLLPESEVPLTVTLANDGGGAADVSATLLSFDSMVQVTKAGALYPPIPHGMRGTNDADPFVLTLGPDVEQGTVVDMTLQVTAAGGYSADLPFQLIIGAGDESVLLVRPNSLGGEDIMVSEWSENMLLDPLSRGETAGDDDILLRGDVNGDRMRDLVRGRIFPPDRIEWSVHLAYPTETGIFYEESPAGVWNADLGSKKSLFFLGDVEGDGLEDLVFTDSGSCGNQGSDVWVSRSDGESFQEPALWSSGCTVSQWGGLFVSDVDGDGRADLLRDGGRSSGLIEWRAALSDGSSFLPWGGWGATPVSSQTAFLLGDVDGDGRADLISSAPSADVRGSLDWAVALSSGEAFLEGTLWLEGFGTKQQAFGLTDSEGDGRSDLLGWSRQRGGWVFEAATSDGSAFTDLGQVGAFGARNGDILLP